MEMFHFRYFPVDTPESDFWPLCGVSFSKSGGSYVGEVAVTARIFVLAMLCVFLHYLIYTFNWHCMHRGTFWRTDAEDQDTRVVIVFVLDSLHSIKRHWCNSRSG